MKKAIIVLSVLAFFSLMSAAARERVYVSTDKSVYVAGDFIWCSAFCVDALSGGGLSSASSVAYLELASAEGVVATSKIALIEGRGCGMIPLPFTVPTGNYKLFAYTALGKRLPADVLEADAKTVSVYNTLVTDRLEGGVDLISRNDYYSKDEAVGGGERMSEGLSLLARRTAEVNSRERISLENLSSEPVTLSLSVYCVDGLPEPGGNGGFFTNSSSVEAASRITDTVSPDFEGETIHGRLYGRDAEKVAADIVPVAIISSPGNSDDTYSGKIDSDGTVLFTTGNIYGDRDLVCEILRLPEGAQCHFTIESPFLGSKPKSVPKLTLSIAMYEDLSRRSEFMQAARREYVDTLFDILPKKERPLLSDANCVRYHLDDYDRFPTVKEMIVEFVKELRVRKSKYGGKEIQILLSGTPSDRPVFSDNVLVMLDGVPVIDHSHMLEFDAMQLSDILIYPYIYVLGEKAFNGVVDFHTIEKNISALRFNDNVMIEDFQGTCYPTAFTCAKGAPVSKDGEDMRSTLYWHPLLSVKAGESLSVDVLAPSYPGVFKAVAEGVTADGKPVRAETTFEVVSGGSPGR